MEQAALSFLLALAIEAVAAVFKWLDGIFVLAATNVYTFV